MNWWGFVLFLEILFKVKPYSIAVNNFVAGQKSSSKGGFMGYIQKLNPFGGSAPFSSNSEYSSAGKSNGY